MKPTELLGSVRKQSETHGIASRMKMDYFQCSSGGSDDLGVDGNRTKDERKLLLFLPANKMLTLLANDSPKDSPRRGRKVFSLPRHKIRMMN